MKPPVQAPEVEPDRPGHLNAELIEHRAELLDPSEPGSRSHDDPGRWQHLRARVRHDGAVDQHPVLRQRRLGVVDRWVELAEPLDQRNPSCHGPRLHPLGSHLSRS